MDIGGQSHAWCWRIPQNEDRLFVDAIQLYTGLIVRDMNHADLVDDCIASEKHQINILELRDSGQRQTISLLEAIVLSLNDLVI